MNEIMTTRIESKLDQIMTRLDRLEARQRATDELIELATPMAKVALDGMSETLGEMERAGYFEFGREFLRVIDRIVRSYSKDDVRRLGDQVVGIVDTVRNLTQPDVLALVNEVAGAVHEADEADPKGMWGLMRAGKDPDVRKGFGVMIGILKQVGRAADKIAQTHTEAPPVRLAVYAGKDGKGPPGWVRHLASRRSALVEAEPTCAAPPTVEAQPKASTVHATPVAGSPALPVGYGLDGFIVDPATWTREHALALADLMSMHLGDAHWQILTWARDEFLKTHASPNIRRLAAGTGVSVREIYTLFPGKPGILVAMLAGIPKPGGCL